MTAHAVPCCRMARRLDLTKKILRKEQLNLRCYDQHYQSCTPHLYLVKGPACRAHDDADISGRKRGCIIDAVAHVHHAPRARLHLLHLRQDFQSLGLSPAVRPRSLVTKAQLQG